MMSDPSLSDEHFDRLADGALPDEEYRRLLAALDDEPGGWRRCALAFLEAQALERDLGVVAAATTAPAQAAERLQRTTSRRGRIWPLVLAMAGCFVIAFVAGSLFRGWGSGAPPVVADTSEEPTSDTDTQISDPAENALDVELAAGGDRQADVPPPGSASELEPLVNLAIEMEGRGGQVRRISVPCFEMDARQAARLAAEEPIVPPGFSRVLRRTGHDLRQRRQLLPAMLEDGRRVVVPMDELEIVPVSSRGYQ